MTRRVLLYARLSVSREESVSIRRQLQSCRRYAESREWEVLAEYVDEGVSATHHRPEDRKGWGGLLSHPESFDTVIVWKVDRLCRRTIDFLNAHESLRERGAGLVAVEDPIDMTTPQGRALATLLAVFAEMEAESISSRAKASRETLLREGRAVGGTVPYGWCSVPNPSGPGYVLRQDPEQIEYVREATRLVLDGRSIYSVVGWLDEVNAPLPEASQHHRVRSGWNYSTVERLLRNPILAGLTPYNPGRGRHETPDPWGVLRDEVGLPVVDESVAIVTVAERRQLLGLLDSRDSPQARPRSSKGSTSPLLSGLVRCGHCERVMHRAKNQERASLKCPQCLQSISRSHLDPYLAELLLDQRGGERVWEPVPLPEPTIAADLAVIESSLTEVKEALGRDDTDDVALLDRLRELKAMRAAVRTGAALPQRPRWTGLTVREAWEAAESDEERRAVLAGQVGAITVLRGKVGRYFDAARVSVTWRTAPGVQSLPTGTELRGPVALSELGEGSVGEVSIRWHQDGTEYLMT